MVEWEWEWAFLTEAGWQSVSNKDWKPISPTALHVEMSLENPLSALWTTLRQSPLRLTLKETLPDHGLLVYHTQGVPDELFAVRKVPLKIVRIQVVSMNKEADGFGFQISNAFTGDFYPTRASTFGYYETFREFMPRVYYMLYDINAITAGTRLKLDFDFGPDDYVVHALIDSFNAAFMGMLLSSGPDP